MEEVDILDCCPPSSEEKCDCCDKRDAILAAANQEAVSTQSQISQQIQEVQHALSLSRANSHLSRANSIAHSEHGHGHGVHGHDL